MIIKITTKRQVTLSAHVLDAMGVGPGATLELIESPDGYLLRQDASTTRAWAVCGSRFRSDIRRSTSGHSVASRTTQPYGIDTSVLTGAVKSALTAPVPENPSPQNRRREP